MNTNLKAIADQVEKIPEEKWNSFGDLLKKYSKTAYTIFVVVGLLLGRGTNYVVPPTDPTPPVVEDKQAEDFHVKLFEKLDNIDVKLGNVRITTIDKEKDNDNN